MESSEQEACLGGLFVIAAMIEIALLARGYFEWWWPRIRERWGVSLTTPISPWHGVFLFLGVGCGVSIWRSLTAHLSLGVAVDYLGRLISLGVGELLFLALFDGWLLWRELQQKKTE